MAKRRRDNGERAQSRRSKEGRGTGRGSDYIPYLLIHDVPSIGLASRIWGWKTNRVHHLLSRLELKFFYTLEWQPDVIDIREQFPLDRDETLAIADRLGVRHPRDPKTKDYVVMTTDFVITVRKGFVTEEQIRTVKYKGDLENTRVREKLEIERVCWQEVRGLDWDIVTEEDVESNVAANVEWLHGHRDIERLAPLTAENVSRIEALLTPRVTQGGFRLRDLTNECDTRLRLDPGESLSVVRHLLANRRWEVDMSTRIQPPLPLVLTTDQPYTPHIPVSNPGGDHVDVIVNALVEWQCLEEGKSDLRIDRVLRVNKAADYVLTIDIGDDRAWAIRRSYSEIVYAVSAGNARVLENEIFPDLLRAEQDIKPTRRAHRDKLYAFLEPLLAHEGEEYMLDPRQRSAKIKELARLEGEFSLTGNMIYLYYRRYLRSGCHRNALLSSHDKCGARGKRRVAERQDMPKPGRRSALGREAERAIGIRITPEIERKFERGVKRFYKDKISLRGAYELTLREFFYKDKKIVNGKRESTLPPAEELPTYKQFRYYYENVYRERDPVAENIRREGERAHNLKSRETIGDPKELAFGPGAHYQIDSTISDVHIVSSLDPLRIIGRPVTYGCMDAFSHAVAGICVTLEGPNWTGAMLAVDIVAAEKVAFCAEYDIPIEASAWPIQGLPQAICADRGEFEGFNATNLVKGLRMRVDTTAPYRADWKALIERQFGLHNERCVNFLPGRVRKLSRGEPDPRLDAMLTLHDFRQLLITYVLDYNLNFYLEKYRKDEFMIADHVERYPLDLWNWGVQNRGKCFNAAARDHIRLNLLPRRTVSVTGSGIYFEKELYYTCERALRENWFSRANLRGNWKLEVAFDPRTTDHVYLIADGGTKIEPCHLTATSRHLKGRDQHEVADYFEMERQAKEADESRRQQSRASVHDKQDAIIARAAERKEVALLAAGKISKSVRVSGMKENRAEEREREREADKWLLGEPDAVAAAGAESKDMVQEIEDEQSYSAPSMLDVLDRQRESRWEGDTSNG